MRQLKTKYAGTCAKCGETIAIGETVWYDKPSGIYHPNCQPTDTEELRHFRQVKADRKADRYQEWAAKRKVKAAAVLQHNARYTEDIAFNTQPGGIPLRNRVIRQNNAAYSSLDKAAAMEDKADRLRHVRVKGDAARAREKRRQYLRDRIKVGDNVCWMGQVRRVVKINRKTVHLGTDDGRTIRVDCSSLRPIKPASGVSETEA